jgi:hypothetical protein
LCAAQREYGAAGCRRLSGRFTRLLTVRAGQSSDRQYVRTSGDDLCGNGGSKYCSDCTAQLNAVDAAELNPISTAELHAVNAAELDTIAATEHNANHAAEHDANDAAQRDANDAAQRDSACDDTAACGNDGNDEPAASRHKRDAITVAHGYDWYDRNDGLSWNNAGGVPSVRE